MQRRAHPPEQNAPGEVLSPQPFMSYPGQSGSALHALTTSSRGFQSRLPRSTPSLGLGQRQLLSSVHLYPSGSPTGVEYGGGGDGGGDGEGGGGGGGDGGDGGIGGWLGLGLGLGSRLGLGLGLGLW